MINRLVVLLLLVLVHGAALPAQAPRSPLAQEVFAAESGFAASMANRDTVAFASWLARDAVFFGGRTVARGRREVMAQWAAFFVGPAAPFSWRPEIVEVTESGTLAHSSGPVFDATGKQVSTFNSVWRKEADGRWWVVFGKGCDCPTAP